MISGTLHFKIGILYHPSNKGTINEFINEWCELLDSLDSSEILWMGDFNIQVNQCTNTDTEQFVQTTEAMGMEQLVSFSTHDLGNTLDIILKEKHTSYEIANIKPGHFISDHRLVLGEITIKHNNNSEKPKKTRAWNKVDMTEYVAKLNIQDILNKETLEGALQTLRSSALIVREELAPEKT